MKKKIAVVGAGNAGCISACQLLDFGGGAGKNLFDVKIYHDPNTPIEKVGQGSTYTVFNMISRVLNLNWYDKNLIDATYKYGILYRNWGSSGKDMMHNFPMSNMASHYIPKKLSDVVLNSNLFEVEEKCVVDPESEIDADYIFDCRGRNHNKETEYTKLTNPLNSVLLYSSPNKTSIDYTHCEATPDGWCFIIPNIDSTSYGYLYNKNITSKDEAENNFKSQFNVPKVDHSLDFDNYVAKSMFHGERTILNGNRFCFIEPLEATSTDLYQYISNLACKHILSNTSKEQCDQQSFEEVKRIEQFILWHYQTGSKFNSPFWDYAKILPFEPDMKFSQILMFIRHNIEGPEMSYSQWPSYSFKLWDSVK